MNTPDSDKHVPRGGTDDDVDADAVADLEAPEHDDVKGAKKATPGRVVYRAKVEP